MARFFIDRPIFAWVIALFILVFGAVAVTQLPVAQYPTVAPPSVVISAVYPGASAKTLDEAVVNVIEQELNGAPGLAYMEGNMRGPSIQDCEKSYARTGIASYNLQKKKLRQIPLAVV